MWLRRNFRNSLNDPGKSTKNFRPMSQKMKKKSKLHSSSDIMFLYGEGADAEWERVGKKEGEHLWPKS